MLHVIVGTYCSQVGYLETIANLLYLFNLLQVGYMHQVGADSKLPK